MAIELRWVGSEEADRVSLTRLRSYSPADKDLERFVERFHDEPRAKDGDFLLAEVDGEPAGTATSLSLKMWVRGAEFPCQGVAWVGAVKTMRRLGGEKSSGVASTVMRETLRKARERGEVISALMPFRASYYEHFGYGIAERRNKWTVPMGILPAGSFEGIRFYEAGDFAARAECLRRVSRAGQCDVERSDEYWNGLMKQTGEGMQIVDRPVRGGPARGSMYFQQEMVNGKDILNVVEFVYEDAAGFRRQLNFLSSLRDQYAAVKMQLPADVPLNYLLKESQLPHRPVNHPVVAVEPITRMQIRVLDHARFLSGVKLSGNLTGKLNVAVHESEGTSSRFALDISNGRFAVAPGTSSADFECADRVWSSVASGELKATDALRWGLASGDGKRAAVLDALAEGPAPFCHEYF